MIKRLTIQNFKAFKRQSLDFAPLTVLTGLNGVGKSTVIQSLLLLRQSYQQRLLPERGLALNGDLIQIGTGQDALFEGNTANDEIGFDLEISDSVNKSWRFAYDTTNEVLQLVDKGSVNANSTHQIYSSELFTDKFQYLQAERIGPRTSSETSEYFVRDHRQLGTKGEFTAHFLTLYEENNVIPSLGHPNAVGNNLRQQVEAWMSEISPGILFDFKAFQKIDRVQVGVSFDTLGNFYRPTNVGFGITYVLPVLVAILSSAPDTLLLIENPEAHLHPRGQSQLGKLLATAADAGIQIVVETHSDHILNGIRIATRNRAIEPEDVVFHYFYRDLDEKEHKGVKVHSPTLDKYGKLSFWPNGFFDEYGKNLDELL